MEAGSSQICDRLGFLTSLSRAAGLAPARGRTASRRAAAASNTRKAQSLAADAVRRSTATEASEAYIIGLASFRNRPHHLAQRWITYRRRSAVGDLFLGPYPAMVAALKSTFGL
jgi:hypothetical protein